MTTLLIDETRAHEIFAGLVETHRALRAHIEQAGLPARSWTEDYFTLDEELSGCIAEVEALISQGAKVELSIPQITAKIAVHYESRPVQIGRPAKTVEEKLAQITELENQISGTKDYQVKLALGKHIRRIRRSLPTEATAQTE